MKLKELIQSNKHILHVLAGKSAGFVSQDSNGDVYWYHTAPARDGNVWWADSMATALGNFFPTADDWDTAVITVDSLKERIGRSHTKICAGTYARILLKVRSELGEEAALKVAKILREENLK